MGANISRNCIDRCASQRGARGSLAAPPPSGAYRRARAATGRMAGRTPA